MYMNCKYDEDDRKCYFCLGCDDREKCKYSFYDSEDANKKCIVIESDISYVFENYVDWYLNHGYEIESSSCNSKSYKAIMIKRE